MASRKNTSSSTDKRILISEGKKPSTEVMSIDKVLNFCDAIGVIVQHGSIESFQSKGQVGQRLNLLLSDEAAAQIVPTQGPSQTQYKVQIVVMDSTGTACFELFDKEAFRKFNKTALEMREQLLQVAGDEFGYPEDLYQILNKQFVFLVDVSQRFNIELNRDNYGILFMSDLDEHLEDFRKFVMENQALLQLSSPLHDGENKEIMAVASDNVRIN
ncbi:hypothetical protein RIF29_15193 [Crotalaria pallida]|uniref:Uncharacterized protein n=1 Tax=Crotalaria pallida TaxID=3830 RepID=A0AAN9IDD9_CROPI